MKTNRKLQEVSEPITLPSRSRLLVLANRLERHPADAEDLVQDAYLRLLASNSDEIREVMPWMRSVMKNLLTDKIRRNELQDRYVALSLNDPSREYPASMTSIVETRIECALALNVMVERLDSHELASLLLREVFEWSYRELSEPLEKSEQATRQMVHRAWRRFHSGGDLVKRRQRRRDLAEVERIYLICLHSLLDRDPEGLRALVSAPRIEALLHRSEYRENTGGNVRSVVHHVGGKFSMSFILDGVVLCVFPLGVTQNVADCEFEFN